MDHARSNSFIKVKVQCMLGEDIAMGPGKASLLEAIAREGSISGAGRALGMSYRRTWMLVDVMNRCWRNRLVDTIAGGGRERGARLTDEGVRVLKAYRTLEAAIVGVTAGPAGAAVAALRPVDDDA
jgi:molybdate transport system regulatory protein